MSDLIIGGPLLFSEPDCPTREGEVVNTLEDIYNIPSPRVGMRVFVKDTKKSYIVTKLKEEEINGVSVPNAKVDEYEDSQPDVAGMNDAIQANATAIKNEKERAVFEETALGNRIQNVYNGIATLNTTIINYNQRYGINKPVTKQEVIKGLLDKYTADKGTIVTYYAEDGWHTIQYKLKNYNPTEGVKESNWVEIGGYIKTINISESSLNDYTDNGEYHITGERINSEDGLPILNMYGYIEGTLKVITEPNTNTSTQILTLLNVGGGDGNIYTRTRQDNTWGTWGKLQTNVEVGLINQQQMDALIDNGICSGILSTTGETFVLVVINNYAIATQAGYGGYISHLKYSVGLDGVVKIETRRRDAFGSWTDWQSIGGGSSYTLPIATAEVLGGIKSNNTYGRVGDNPYGEEFALNVSGDGIASVTIPRADDYDGQYGLVKVDTSINPESKNPVSGKAVAEAIYTSVVNQTTTTATIAPNVLNVWGEVAQLDITLGDGKVDVVNEYMFQFTSGATATTLVMPADINWLSAPNIQANKTYQVSIINNLGVIGEFSHE